MAETEDLILSWEGQPEMAGANAALGCLRGIAVAPLWNLMEPGI